MGKYKTLKSIGHNVAHSLMSLLQYDSGKYFNQRIFEIVKKNNITEIEIDILNQSISPQEFQNRKILQAIESQYQYLSTLATKQESSIDLIKSLKIYLNYDLSKTKISKTADKLELESYDCKVELIDDRNKVYTVDVIEWWKY